MAIAKYFLLIILTFFWFPQAWASSAYWEMESSQYLTDEPSYQAVEGIVELPKGTPLVTTLHPTEKVSRKKVDGVVYFHVYINCDENLGTCKSGWIKRNATKKVKSHSEFALDPEFKRGYAVVPTEPEVTRSGQTTVTTTSLNKVSPEATPAVEKRATEPAAAGCEAVDSLSNANLAGAPIISGDEFIISDDSGEDTFAILESKGGIFVRVLKAVNIPATICKTGDQLVVNLNLPKLIQNMKSLPAVVPLTITGTSNPVSNLSAPAKLGMSGKVRRVVK